MKKRQRDRVRRSTPAASLPPTLAGLPVKAAPMSVDVALDLDHVGLIRYPHERLDCLECLFNGTVAHMLDDARAEFGRKIDSAIFGEGGRN